MTDTFNNRVDQVEANNFCQIFGITQSDKKKECRKSMQSMGSQ